MAITARNKMRAAKRCDVSYWGRHHQTFRFRHLDHDEQDANWKAAARLVDAASAEGAALSDERRVWGGVPDAAVRRFLEAYVPHPDHKDLAPEFLLSFIEQRRDRLAEWNVAVVEPARSELSAEALGGLGPVRTVRRAKLKDHKEDVADIKALMSKQDILFDCREEVDPDGLKDWQDLKRARDAATGETPLLLLYAIERHSPPRTEGGQRVALDACRDMIGYGIVFPGRRPQQRGLCQRRAEGDGRRGPGRGGDRGGRARAGGGRRCLTRQPPSGRAGPGCARGGARMSA